MSELVAIAPLNPRDYKRADLTSVSTEDLIITKLGGGILVQSKDATTQPLWISLFLSKPTGDN
jgi:hypothetical protein